MPDLRSRTASKRAKRVILVAAFAVPLGVPLLGALITWSAGGNPIDGAFIGCLAVFLLIGFGWIGLGVVAARRELRSRRLHEQDPGEA